MDDKAHRYAVLGNPVLHSLSPGLFQAAFEHFGIRGSYLRIHAASIDAALQAASGMNLAGFNLTAPFKVPVASRLDRLDEPARAIGAVNTVVRRGNRLCGHNTDWQGVLEALRRGGVDPRGCKAVVLGAGGAGRAAAWGLMRAGTREVIIANRTESRAREAAARLGCGSIPLDDLAPELASCDVLIGCLPAGTPLPFEPALHPGLAVLDANYHRPVLQAAARNAGCVVLNGLDWLRGQATAACVSMLGRRVPFEVLQTVDRGGAENRLSECRHLALIGFMGAGKSTIGPMLAARLGLSFTDTDSLVERRAGLGISEIFSRLGEDGFRLMEARVVEEVLDGEPRVISCGGGALLDSSSRFLIRRDCLVVWLWSSPEVILKRIDGNQRPLLGPRDRLGTTRKLLGNRLDHYARASDLVVENDGYEPAKTAERIANEVRGCIHA